MLLVSINGSAIVGLLVGCLAPWFGCEKLQMDSDKKASVMVVGPNLKKRTSVMVVG